MKNQKRFTYQTSIRLDDEVRLNMNEVCDRYKMREADYIRKSIERNLVRDTARLGIEPKFHSYAN